MRALLHLLILGLATSESAKCRQEGSELLDKCFLQTNRVSVHQQTPVQGDDHLHDNKASSHNQEGATAQDLFYVVPELKLLFCWTPKNACTQFGYLMNMLNGVQGDSHLTSLATNFVKGWGRTQLLQHLQDPLWTKAVFLRDPLERLVSAYRDKCLYPVDGSEEKLCLAKNFSTLVDKLPETSNHHYLPQTQLCTGLSDTAGVYDFIGILDHDRDNVHEQVKEMLHLALRRHHQAHLPHVPNQENLSREEKLDYGATLYFPSSDINSTDLHTTHTGHVETYFQPSSLTKALQFYARDYNELSALEIPMWARKMAAA